MELIRLALPAQARFGVSKQPSAINGTTSGEQQAQGWKRFSVAGIPRAMGKPTVDDSTLTCIPGKTDE
jgi:hypothetical protein